LALFVVLLCFVVWPGLGRLGQVIRRASAPDLQVIRRASAPDLQVIRRASAPDLQVIRRASRTPDSQVSAPDLQVDSQGIRTRSAGDYLMCGTVRKHFP
jgi:hypothetical protein